MKQVLGFCLLLLFGNVNAQDAGVKDEWQQKAQRWVDGLKLDDKIKADKVQQAIVMHLTAVRGWHNSHPFTQVPAGINPATGNKLSDLDRQLIVCSSKPATIHTSLMQVLATELNVEQVAFILDQYTIGKVAFTMRGYEAIVPDLTEKERAEIRKNLEQAREQAIDYKNMKEISGIFEIYKTKCEQYLNSNGRNWRQLFKNYVDKVKAEKEKKKSGAL